MLVGSYDYIAVLAVLVFILISLYKELFGPGFTFIIGVGILGVLQILTPKEILAGFANEQIAVIIMLLLLGDVFQKTSVLDILFDRIFRRVVKPKRFMLRMMLLVAALSAFLNNTPLVALLIPYVHTWSKRNKMAVSKFLMPLSFAAILGGCATLIGTSTNLMVNGMVQEQNIFPELESLNIFDFSYVGVPMIVIGTIYLLTIGYKLLPATTGVIEDFSKNSRKYIVELKIKEGSPIAGKTVTEASLRNLEGLYLFEVIRNNEIIVNVSPETILFENDILIFTGDTASIASMVTNNPSLVIPSVGMFSRKKNTRVTEIVISHNSTLVNKTVKSENFRGKYDATVLAVHRNGEKLSGKIGSIIVQPGDALLLLTGSDFASRAKNTRDFFIISNVKEIHRIGIFKTAFLIGGTILTIVLSALGIISLFMGLVALLSISIMLKLSTPKELAHNIDYDLGFILAMSLAIGTAMIKTGLAEQIAQLIIKAFSPMGKVGLLFGIYFITSILAAYITNKAAIAIIFPISLAAAAKLGYNPVPFILVVSFAAAANFITPIGYQTNLMVFGPGRYSFKHFFKVGLPLTIIYMIVTVVILRFIYF